MLSSKILEGNEHNTHEVKMSAKIIVEILCATISIVNISRMVVVRLSYSKKRNTIVAPQQYKFND